MTNWAFFCAAFVGGAIGQEVSKRIYRKWGIHGAVFFMAAVIYGCVLVTVLS